MEQRQVRLGDVLDDYCPHERRVTNHAVVAIVGDVIKLTRCTTCDDEHPYKAAKVPPRRQTRLVAAVASADAAPPALQSAGKAAASADEALSSVAAPGAETAAPAPAASAPPAIDSVRRPLIRATLSRPAGTPPPARQPPVFTIRETGRDAVLDRNGKQNRKRRNGGWQGGEANGNRIEGHQGQGARPGQGKSASRSSRPRQAGTRTDRQNRGQSRRGKGRSR